MVNNDIGKENKMKTEKETGTWEINEYNGQTYLDEVGGDCIARMVNGTNKDARLIAAAPALLKALEELVAEFDARNEEDCETQGHYGFVDTVGITWAREAIAKAR